ncbi:Chromosome transmission fidelity protein 8 [Hyaloscypha variabilis]
MPDEERVKIHTARGLEPISTSNPLPHVIQTKAGLALLEMQGTINLPGHGDEAAMSTGEDSGEGEAKVMETPVGRLVFPDYEGDEGGDGWMKRVYLYVGKHQRLTGEVKKLPKAIAVIRKRRVEDGDQKGGKVGDEGGEPDELEVVEIIKYKILFSTRPEPVGTWAVGD